MESQDLREGVRKAVSIYEDPTKLLDLMDIHGFIRKSKQDYDERKEADPLRYHFLQKRNNARLEKWRKLLPSLEEKVAKKTRSRKLKKKVRKGVPDCLRGLVWCCLTQINKIKKEVDDTFTRLKDEQSPFENEIRLDVCRTFPNHAFFGSKNHDRSQNSLQIVLKALSLVFKDMGYCQGLNFICATLLIYLNDEEAFWVMVSLMNKYQLLEYYQDLAKIRKPFYVFEELAKRFLPKIADHLNKVTLTADIYAPAWFLTLYVSVLPFNIVLRILDVFLYEGFKILYRIGLFILKIKEDKILKTNQMDQIMMVLKTFAEKEFDDEDVFMKGAHKFVFTYAEINKLEAQYEKTLNSSSKVSSPSPNKPRK